MMKNLLSVLFYLSMITLILPDKAIADEGAGLTITMLAKKGSESYDAFIWAIELSKTSNKMKPVALHRETNCTVFEEKEKVASSDIIFIDPDEMCTSDEIENIVQTHQNILFVSFSVPTLQKNFEKQLSPEVFNQLLLIRFETTFPPFSKSSYSDRFSREKRYSPNSPMMLPTLEATRILFKVIEKFPNRSLKDLSDEVKKFKVVRTKVAPLRADPHSSDQLQKEDKILNQGDIVIQQNEPECRYLDVESFSGPTQGQRGWIQKKLIAPPE